MKVATILWIIIVTIGSSIQSAFQLTRHDKRLTREANEQKDTKEHRDALSKKCGIDIKPGEVCCVLSNGEAYTYAISKSLGCTSPAVEVK